MHVGMKKLGDEGHFYILTVVWLHDCACVITKILKLHS